MENYTIQQEILLVTNNTFSQNQWCEKNTVESDKQLSHAEQLEEACWNGLLNDLLPELVEKPGPDNRLFLWNVKKGDCVLQLELGEYPLEIEKEFSIDGNCFMQGRYN